MNWRANSATAAASRSCSTRTTRAASDTGSSVGGWTSSHASRACEGNALAYNLPNFLRSLALSDTIVRSLPFARSWSRSVPGSSDMGGTRLPAGRGAAVAAGTLRQDPSPDRPLARTARCGGLTGANHGTAAAEWRAVRRRLASDTRPTRNPASSASMAQEPLSSGKLPPIKGTRCERSHSQALDLKRGYESWRHPGKVYFNASAASSWSNAQQGNVIMEWTVLKADTQELRRSAFHLRYKAYYAAGAIEATKSQLLTDKYDGQPNGFTYLLIKGRDLVGSIRALIYSPNYNRLPISSFETWEKDIIEKLGPNTTIVEASRFAMHPDSVGTGLEAQSQLFQTIIANALKHNARYLVAAARTKHQAFYKRMLGFFPITAEINASEHYGFKMHGALLASDMALSYEHMCTKIPALRIGEQAVERYATPFLDETSHATERRRGSPQLAHQNKFT